MRHRLVSGTGLGNPLPHLLNNTGSLNEEFAKNALSEYFEDGFDYEVTKEYTKIGIEPAYQDEKLKIICITKNKEESYIQTGKAWGAYGSGIAQTTKRYSDYKKRGKFIKFVDKWHSVLFGDKK